MNSQRDRGPDMAILTRQEKEFLDVFLHEATTAPFTGPATKALHAIGAEYSDISYLAWAYHREVPRSSCEWGHPAHAAPQLPWPTREQAKLRDKEIEHIWAQLRQAANASI